MSNKLIDANSPEFLARVDTLSKLVNANIARYEDSPQVIIPVLQRLLVVSIASETFHLAPKEVLRNAIKSFRGGLIEAQEKMKIALAQLDAREAQGEE